MISKFYIATKQNKCVHYRYAWEMRNSWKHIIIAHSALIEQLPCHQKYMTWSTLLGTFSHGWDELKQTALVRGEKKQERNGWMYREVLQCSKSFKRVLGLAATLGSVSWYRCQFRLFSVLSAVVELGHVYWCSCSRHSLQCSYPWRATSVI